MVDEIALGDLFASDDRIRSTTDDRLEKAMYTRGQIPAIGCGRQWPKPLYSVNSRPTCPCSGSPPRRSSRGTTRTHPRPWQPRGLCGGRGEASADGGDHRRGVARRGNPRSIRRRSRAVVVKRTASWFRLRKIRKLVRANMVVDDGFMYERRGGGKVELG